MVSEIILRPTDVSDEKHHPTWIRTIHITQDVLDLSVTCASRAMDKDFGSLGHVKVHDTVHLCAWWLRLYPSAYGYVQSVFGWCAGSSVLVLMCSRGSDGGQAGHDATSGRSIPRAATSVHTRTDVCLLSLQAPKRSVWDCGTWVSTCAKMASRSRTEIFEALSLLKFGVQRVRFDP